MQQDRLQDRGQNQQQLVVPKQPEADRQPEEASYSILSCLYKIATMELAKAVLYQNLWIQACGLSQAEIQSLAKEEESKSLSQSKECMKFAIVLFGGNAASLSLIPCQEFLGLINEAKGLKKIIELGYQQSMQIRHLYLDLSRLLQQEHPDIANWSLNSAKLSLDSFYIFQSLLS